MSSYSPAFRKEIESRIKSGNLKVSGNPDLLPIMSAKDDVKPSNSGSLSRMQALGRLKAREMNETELAYSQYLDALKACGEVLWWEFESIRLRLADNTTYTPDFFVMVAGGQLEVHEIKGYAMEDSMVKLKIADEMYPFRFLLIKSANKFRTEWTIKEIGNRKQ